MKYTTYKRAASLNGTRGYDYEIRDASGRVVRCGWTAGGVADVRQEIDAAIREIEAKEAA